MAKNLVIVESPAKAKTIEKYLGKDFIVKSSFGHVRDLVKGNDSIDVEHGFAPKYAVSADKKKVVSELKKLAKEVDFVWLASDEDREGEAISWHLTEALGLKPDKYKRITFNEITKTAVLKAIENPREIDADLVNAQQARRVLDRLVGFELSPVLWRKVKPSLSAGRVQSVAVRLIVEREKEISEFIPKPFFRTDGKFKVNGSNIKAKLNHQFDEEAQAKSFLEGCKDFDFKVKSVTKKPAKKSPTAPFTTSTLQQEASLKLGFSVSRTMGVAQRLYEAGRITYMRTDSVNLSQTALDGAKDAITSNYGAEYHNLRTFKTKSSGAQEAHEAIRPTDFSLSSISGESDEERLYQLIWKRSIASQMSDAQLERTTVKLDAPDGHEFTANGEVIKFDGFLKVYLESKLEEEEEEMEGLLPDITEGQLLDRIEIMSTERFTRPPARYVEASLVKKLEELGIGRPSTYAPTISKIMEEGRGYVTKESRDGEEREYRHAVLKDGSISKSTKTEITGATKNRLYASDMGIVVSDFLTEHFADIMNYGFTAEVEDKLDKIADGKQEWRKLLKDFYVPFHENVEDTQENADRASGERTLGKDPESGKTVLVRMARFGPVVQIGAPDELDEDEKPKFANLKPTQSIENITFDEAMTLFELPKTLGDYKGNEVVIARGRFGPYIKYMDKFVNIPRGEDPLDMEMERAQELIDQKIKEDAPVGSYKGIPYTKGKGRFGPFLKYDGMFVNVPKKYDFENLAESDAHELIEAKIQKEANRYIQRWESEKLAIENGRWGPFIRFGKKSVKLPRVDKKAMSQEDAAKLTLEEVKKLVEAEIPGAFSKEKKKTTKKKTAKKK